MTDALDWLNGVEDEDAPFTGGAPREYLRSGCPGDEERRIVTDISQAEADRLADEIMADPTPRAYQERGEGSVEGSFIPDLSWMNVRDEDGNIVSSNLTDAEAEHLAERIANEQAEAPPERNRSDLPQGWGDQNPGNR